MEDMAYRSLRGIALAFMLSTLGSLTGCTSGQAGSRPSIEFTHVPAAGHDDSGRLERIAGRAKKALPGDRIVLFALSGV